MYTKNSPPGSGDVRMLRESEAVSYTAMGRTNFRRWAKEIGAVRHFGRSVRYDRAVIDAALDEIRD